MKVIIYLFLAVSALGSIFFVFRQSIKTKAWTKEPQQFLDITLGKPVSASLLPCKPIDDGKRCYDAEYSTAENVTDSFGLVSVVSKHGLVQQIMVTISAQNADLAYKDLIDRFGEPTSHMTAGVASWDGKHVTINFLRPSGRGDPGSITVWDSDVQDDPAPKHVNTF